MNSFLTKISFHFIAFSITFLVIFSLLFSYNKASIFSLELEFENKYQEIVDIVKRFHSYYVNADIIRKKHGVYEENGVGVIVNESAYIKELTPAITLLYDALKTVINIENLWTIAIFEKSPVKSMKTLYFFPLRFVYLNSNNYSSEIQSIINYNGDLSKNYYDDLRVTDFYNESHTNEYINTMVYPIYLNGYMVSVVAIDLKFNLNNEIFSNFLSKKWLYIETGVGSEIITTNIKIPYTSNDVLFKKSNVFPVKINLKKILISAMLFSFLIYSIFLIVQISYLKFELLNSRDKMTGFFRRDFYNRKLKKIKKSSIVIIDIDNFKTINDKYGHDTGDEVIKIVTERISKSIRVTDDAIRWGGEEFVLILDEMEYEQLESKAEYIRLCISKSKINNINVTVSIGAAIQNISEHVLDTFNRADESLYLSKNNGRNLVTISREY